MNLHEALLKVRDLLEAGEHDPAYGICAQLTDGGPYRGWSMPELSSLFVRWPKFSGNLIYPVSVDHETPDISDPVSEYDDAFDVWTGPYGDLRRELLDWLIEQTRPTGE